MADKIDWVVIKRFNRPIGAIGFLNDQAVAVIAFYEDADGNQDGKVSWGEWAASKLSFNLQGMAATEVAMQARHDPDVMMRDPGFNQMAMNMFTSFASGLIAQGIYMAYFSRGVASVGTGLASVLTTNTVKAFVIRKGFEGAVKKVFMESVGY